MCSGHVVGHFGANPGLGLTLIRPTSPRVRIVDVISSTVNSGSRQVFKSRTLAGTSISATGCRPVASPQPLRGEVHGRCQLGFARAPQLVGGGLNRRQALPEEAVPGESRIIPLARARSMRIVAKCDARSPRCASGRRTDVCAAGPRLGQPDRCAWYAATTSRPWWFRRGRRLVGSPCCPRLSLLVPQRASRRRRRRRPHPGARGSAPAAARGGTGKPSSCKTQPGCSGR